MLSVSHLLASGRHTKWRAKPLKNVVCVSLAPICLQITVTRDGDQLDPHALLNAPATQHLLRTLHHYAAHLNIQHVSDPFVEEGVAQIQLSPMLFATQPRVHAELRALKLSYTWISDESQQISDTDPWSPNTLLLPHQALLDELHVDGVVRKQLLGNYPFIFGCWRKGLEIERPFLGIIASSLVNMIARSSHDAFVDRASELLEELFEYTKDSETETMARMRKSIDKKVIFPEGALALTNHTAIIATLLNAYEKRVRPKALNKLDSAVLSDGFAQTSPERELHAEDEQPDLDIFAGLQDDQCGAEQTGNALEAQEEAGGAAQDNDLLYTNEWLHTPPRCSSQTAISVLDTDDPMLAEELEHDAQDDATPAVATREYLGVGRDQHDEMPAVALGHDADDAHAEPDSEFEFDDGDWATDDAYSESGSCASLMLVHDEAPVLAAVAQAAGPGHVSGSQGTTFTVPALTRANSQASLFLDELTAEQEEQAARSLEHAIRPFACLELPVTQRYLHDIRADTDSCLDHPHETNPWRLDDHEISVDADCASSVDEGHEEVFELLRG